MGQKVQFPVNQIDQFTKFPIVVQSDHAYIHDGIGYTISGATASIAAGASWTMVIETPLLASGKFIHFRPIGFSSTANIMEARIAESTTYSGGSAVTPWNRNRNSSIASACTVKTGVTITAEGAVKLGYFSAGTGGVTSRSGGVADGSAEEIVLKPGTTYSITFSNIGTTTATIGYYSIFWYEETAGA